MKLSIRASRRGLEFFLALKKRRFSLPLMLKPRMALSSPIVKRIPGTSIVMHLDPSESLDSCYLAGKWDKKSLHFIVSSLEDCTYFVDLGSNQGFYSFFVRKALPNINILSIEPDPVSLAKWHLNASANEVAFCSDVESLESCTTFLFQGGVTHDEKMAVMPLMLNTAGNRAGSSVVIDQRRWTKLDENITIPIRTSLLSTLFEQYGVNNCVLKIDIEGYEAPVLRTFFTTAPRTLWPRAIVCEFTGIIFDTEETVLELLIHHGYKLVGLEDVNYFWELTQG